MSRKYAPANSKALPSEKITPFATGTSVISSVLGKDHLYVLELEQDEIHENDAALILGEALAGEGVTCEGAPKEGKVRLLAERDGLLMVDTAALAAFNMVEEVMCATLHRYTLVKAGEMVAATRAIPLVMKRVAIERAAAIAKQNGGALTVKPLRKAKVGLIITGNEVYHGRIQDRFGPILTEKVRALGSGCHKSGFRSR